jgi:hypothetical protein
MTTLVATILIVLVGSNVRADSGPIVKVTGGQIRGASLDKGGAVFKGIPYAQPPVGDLRWREPMPVKPWTGVRDATAFGAICPQSPMFIPNGAISKEDCLYLNVWTPEWPSRSRKAVMVWIPSGGNIFGGIAAGNPENDGNDGESLARRGVVVVSLNYRLGALGFFSHPALTRESSHHASGPTPRTADGKPDLSGIWTLLPSGGGVSRLKPAEIKPWAEEVHKQRMEELGKGSPGVQCLPGGLSVVGLMKFVQTPGLIVVLNEDLSYRQIFLDGRELPKDPNPAWMGYSVGHWDGDTLVVESAGYNERTWLDDSYPHTENLRVTERIRRSDFGHLAIEATLSDPAAYEKPWTTKTSGVSAADTELLEYVCAENEKDRVHLVGKNSDDLKNAVTVSPEILSK